MEENKNKYSNDNEKYYLLEEINKKLDNLNHIFIQNKIVDFIELLGNRKKLLFNNLFSGIAKGIGIGIGVTLITAIIVTILQKIVTLNIPIIGEYVGDIIDIVEKNR